MEVYSFIRGKKNKVRLENIVKISALIHDIGHGPLSHTLEKLDILSLNNLNEFVKNTYILDFLSQKIEKPTHEEFSLIYLDNLSQDQDNDFLKNESNFLMIACMIHKGFCAYIMSKENPLNEIESRFTKMFAICISSIFDVDRLDYLVRDSIMAGVYYGRVDTQRIINTLIPVIYSDGSNEKSGFAMKARMVYVLDHFLISLYSMYAMIYFHPTNKLFDEQLFHIIKRLKELKKIDNIDFSSHKKLNDTNFLSMIDEKSNGLYTSLLTRRGKKGKSVYQAYSNELIDFMKEKGWSEITECKRAMFSDYVNIWLSDFKGNFFKWNSTSIVADKLNFYKYFPKIYWDKNSFEKIVNNIKN